MTEGTHKEPHAEDRFAVFLRSMLSRFGFTCTVVLLVLGCSSNVDAAGFDSPNAVPVADESESAKDFDVGARLLATTDVKLRDVSLSKGARIVVRGVESKRGRAASFDVELADGQVLKHIDAGTIRRAFVEAND